MQKHVDRMKTVFDILPLLVYFNVENAKKAKWVFKPIVLPFCLQG